MNLLPVDELEAAPLKQWVAGSTLAGDSSIND